MYDAFSQVFKRSSDHYKWDKQIEFAQKNRKFSPAQSRNLIDCYEFLRVELGESFLQHKTNIYYPVLFHINNKADYSIHWIIRFSNTLKFFKSYETNYKALIGKIKISRKCNEEGIPFLEIAEMFSRADFKIEFEPTVDAPKKQDIKLVDVTNNQEIYVEISRLNDSAKRVLQTQMYHSIFNKLTRERPIIPFSAKLLKRADADQLSRLLSEINDFKEQAQVKQKFLLFKDYYKNDLLELAVAPTIKSRELKSWCKKKGCEVGNLIGLSLDKNEFERIRDNKIKREAKQIPAGYPGLIVIPVDPLFFWLRDPMKVIIELRRRVIEFPNIIGVLLYAHIGSSNNDDIRFDKNSFYSQQEIYKDVQLNKLFVCNENLEVNMKEDSLIKMYKALLNLPLE